MKFMPGAVLVLAGLLGFAACTGEPPKIIIPPEGNSGETAPPFPYSDYQILNYRSADSGGRIPDWVSRFLEQGSRGVEEMAA
jgi:hypothetical protein